MFKVAATCGGMSVLELAIMGVCTCVWGEGVDVIEDVLWQWEGEKG